MAAKENENPKESFAPLQSDNPEGAWLETGWSKFPLHGGLFHRSIAEERSRAGFAKGLAASRDYQRSELRRILVDRLGSSNGTFLNKRRIPEQDLK
jgi:hypothetical protein